MKTLIYEERVNRGLADLVHADVKSIKEWEAGRSRPAAESKAALCQALGLRPEELQRKVKTYREELVAAAARKALLLS